MQNAVVGKWQMEGAQGKELALRKENTEGIIKYKICELHLKRGSSMALREHHSMRS